MFTYMSRKRLGKVEIINFAYLRSVSVRFESGWRFAHITIATQQ